MGCVVSLLLSCDLMHLTHGMCGVSSVAMLDRDSMKMTHDCFRLIQDHFCAENIGRVSFVGYSWTVIFGAIPLGMLNLICDYVRCILMDCDYV